MKRIKLTTLILISAIGFCNKVCAQTKNDSLSTKVDSNNITFYYPKSAFSAKDTMPLDTALYGFQNYDIRNSKYDMAAGTMTTGDPIKNLYFNELSPVFSIGENIFGKYFFESADMPRYNNVKIPYSEIFYTIAGQSENYLNGRLASQISDRIYFGLNFNVESTLGLFYNQKVSNSHFQGLFSFETLNKKYGYDVEYIYNKFKIGENGGLQNSAYYQDSLNLKRQVLPVNLNYATNSLKSHYFAFNQHFNIGETSTDTTNDKFIGKIYLNTLYKKTGRMYNDQLWDSSYYQYANIDSLQSKDSSAYTDFNLNLGLSNFYPKKNKYITFDAGIGYNYKMYFNGQHEFYFNYLVPHTDLILDFKKVILESSFKYNIKMDKNNFNIGANNLNFYNNINFKLLKTLCLNVGLKIDVESPQMTSYSMYSNHFIWTNYDFLNQKHINLNSSLDFKGYEIEGSIQTIENYVYYTERNPIQFSNSFQIISAKVNKHFMFKHFGFALMTLYQNSNNNEVIHLAPIIAKTNFYFSFPLFKKALTIHPGIDITYLSSYYADGYNPSFMQFYVQNEKKLDNQVYIDLYINFKIKRARVFIKYQNLGSVLGTYNYFLVQRYPQQDGVFKIGMSWKFFN